MAFNQTSYCLPVIKRQGNDVLIGAVPPHAGTAVLVDVPDEMFTADGLRVWVQFDDNGIASGTPIDPEIKAAREDNNAAEVTNTISLLDELRTDEMRSAVAKALYAADGNLDVGRLADVVLTTIEARITTAA